MGTTQDVGCRGKDGIGMTIKEFMHDQLDNMAIPEDDLTPMMEYIRASPTFSNMEYRWNDDMDGYPDGYWASFLFSVKILAREWAVQNKPNAFYLMMLPNMKKG
jgi:hypothetical protein